MRKVLRDSSIKAFCFFFSKKKKRCFLTFFLEKEEVISSNFFLVFELTKRNEDLESHSKGQFCKNTVYLERDMPYFAFVSTNAALVRKIDKA